MDKIILNKTEIMGIIPHRDPMLLIDEVIDLKMGESIEATFYVNPDREIFKGHFPGAPVLPGVYTVEIMAQTSDVLLLSMDRYLGTIPYFIGIDKVQFKTKIQPGDNLVIKSKITKENKEKRIVTCSAEVYNEGVLACVGDVTLAMRDS